MTDRDVPTDPYASDPPDPLMASAERFAQLVGVIVEPLKDELRMLNVNVELAIKQGQNLAERVTLLERRVSKLETPPPTEAA